MIIEAIYGTKNSGKTYEAQLLTEKYEEQGLKVMRLSFAEPLKLLVENYIEGKDVGDTIDKNVYYRKPLQEYGDAVRSVDIDFFAKVMVNKIKQGEKDGYQVFIIDDLRFENEAKGLVEIGSCAPKIKFTKKVCLDSIIVDSHGSERQIDLIEKYLKDRIGYNISMETKTGSRY